MANRLMEQVTAERNVVPSESPKSPASEKRIKIRIASDRGGGGSDDVVVSVNGEALLIKRDTEVIVRERYYSALMNAVQEEWNTDQDGNVTGVRLVPRYNVQVVG